MIKKWWNKQGITIRAALITGTIGLVATCCSVVGAFGGNLILQYLSDMRGNEELYSDVIPTAGAQIDFSPIMEINPSTIVDDLELKPSRYNGIFLSALKVDRGTAESWKAHYRNGEVRIAESDICLSNVHPEAGPLGGPLNVKVSKVALDITIYTDYRYKYKINSIEVTVSSFVPQQPDLEIEYVTPSMPGAGGWGGPFQIVQTKRVFIEGDNRKTQKVDFQDFTLEPNNGVRIFIPVTFVSAGDYNIFVKIFGNATPIYDDEKGDLSLTTDSKSFQWTKLGDPRDYEIKADTTYPLDLIQCP